MLWKTLFWSMVGRYDILEYSIYTIILMVYYDSHEDLTVQA